MSSFRRFDLEEINGVAVVTLIDRKILDEVNIQDLGAQLVALVEEEHHLKLLLDFNRVEYMSDAALGKFIVLDKKMKAAKGKLRFCSIRPEIYEVLAITRLNKLFDIRENRDQALPGM